jgi:beta-phosphoglucomutase
MNPMALKAVLFDFNGVIINDEPIHEAVLEVVLLEENIRVQAGEFQEMGLGRSDRACIIDFFARRERILSDRDLSRILARKQALYCERLAQLDKIPSYPGLDDLIYKLRVAQIKMAIVSGSQREGIDIALDRLNLTDYFSVIVSADDILTSKPDPEGYLLGIERLNQAFPGLDVTPKNSLAIEDSPAGIAAAKQAGITVVGVANSFPFHMLQRQANWTVDYLNDLELDRIDAILNPNADPANGPADRPIPVPEPIEPTP